MSFDTRTFLANLAATILLLTGYYLITQAPASAPQSPAGAVQGVTTTTDPRLDDVIIKLNNHLEESRLESAHPTIYNLGSGAYHVGTGTVAKGQTQVTLSDPLLTPTSAITITFHADYAPAKKSWVVSKNGSFTLFLDFPVGSDTPFTYSYLSDTPTATPSATPKTTPTSDTTILNPQVKL
jgi:hypothetical protein